MHLLLYNVSLAPAFALLSVTGPLSDQDMKLPLIAIKLHCISLMEVPRLLIGLAGPQTIPQGFPGTSLPRCTHSSQAKPLQEFFLGKACLLLILLNIAKLLP